MKKDKKGGREEPNYHAKYDRLKGKVEKAGVQKGSKGRPNRTSTGCRQTGKLKEKKNAI